MPRTQAEQRTLQAIRAVNTMTDALAAALTKHVDEALRYATPERVLEELTHAWGDGAHDAAAAHIADCGWQWSDTHHQWIAGPIRDAA